MTRVVPAVRRYVVAIGTVGLFALEACAQQNHGSPAQVDTTSAAVTHPSAESGESGAFVDRRPEINPTPQEITQRHFRILRSEISKVRALRGQAPSTLAEILTRPEPDPNLRPRESWLLDGWNRPIRYIRPNEFRSAGADGVFETADDLVSRAPD